MPGWQEGSGFRIVGFVTKKFAAQSGKFGRVTVDVNQSPHPAKMEIRTFDPALVADIGKLQAGQKVQIRGRIENEKLKTRDKEEVKVNGFAYWATILTMTEMEIEGSGRKSEPSRPDGQSPSPAARNPFGGDAPSVPTSDPFGSGGKNPFGG